MDKITVVDPKVNKKEVAKISWIKGIRYDSKKKHL